MIVDFKHIRQTLFASLGLVLVPGCEGTGTESGTDATTSVTSDTATSEGTQTGSSNGTETTESTSSGTSPSGSESDASTDTPTTESSTSGDPEPCLDPQPIDQADVDPPTPSGFVECASGAIARPEQVECLSPATPSTCVDNSDGGPCTVDADCGEDNFGSCHQDQVFGGLTQSTTCHCVYGCATDADCDPGEICRCAGSGLGQATECVAAPECVTNDDCNGYLCALEPDFCAPGGFKVSCQGPDDACQGPNDCENSVFCSPEGGAWECIGVDCGRPFTVAGATRVATPVTSDTRDWCASLDVAALPNHPGLASYWRHLASLEHASVASFARFVQHLLVLGAPPDLIAGASKALGEEIRHTAICGGLAEGFGARPQVPGRLDIRGSVAQDNVYTITLGLVQEACIGETLSAIEVAEAARRCREPEVRARLSEIAEDELRHAALGWRALQWILKTGEEPLRAAVEASFKRSLSQSAGRLPPATPSQFETEAFGQLDPSTRFAVRQRGLEEVVRPCAEALFQLESTASVLKGYLGS